MLKKFHSNNRRGSCPPARIFHAPQEAPRDCSPHGEEADSLRHTLHSLHSPPHIGGYKAWEISEQGIYGLTGSGGQIGILISCLWLLPLVLHAAPFTVNSINDSGSGSLRQAITDANAAGGLNTISFQIPGAAPFSISPLSPLPALAAPVVLDATTQPGFAGSPIIELNGVSAGIGTVGLRVAGAGGGSTIRGLIINRFTADGIRLDSGNNVIQGNYIGTDVTGTLPRGNGQIGVFVLGTSTNVIGGTNVADRNVISGNNDTGIYILNGRANLVQGNYIGLNAAGTADLGNVNNGIAIYNAPANTIGGLSPSARNVISGNDVSGIYLNSALATGNWILGNYIGVNAAGTAAISNAADGITVGNAPANLIGGTNAGAGNLISGNGRNGIYLYGASTRNSLIAGNSIGTDAAGTAALGNTFYGVLLLNSGSNRIGSAMVESRNIISGNRQQGILLSTNSNGNQIQNNFIGLATNGTSALGNALDGIALDNAAFNQIGDSGAGNVISGNTNNGVFLLGGGASNNIIQGNYIGTDVSGHGAVRNAASGVRVESPANEVGGNAPGDGNLISGNGYLGVWLLNSNAIGNLVHGNLIGTAAGGMTGLGNAFGGLGLSDAASNQIGGFTVADRNLISANGSPGNSGGVFLVGNQARGNRFYGNFIGTDITGQAALPNRYEGFYLSAAVGNLIGSELPGGGNLISGNTTRGLYFINNSWGNVIRGNFIGTKMDGVSPLGNGQHSIEFEANCNSNYVGGTVPGAGNRIAYAQIYTGGPFAGVRVRDLAFNNLILGNAIFSNSGLGIDLSTFGVSANDSCDSDGGANMLQNFPTLTQAYSGGNLGVRVTLDSAANTTFRLQFFASPTCDASGNGEGSVYLGDQLVSTGPACATNFLVTLPVSVAAGQVITATATDPANNTSEFSVCRAVLPAPQLSLVPVGSAQLSLAWTNTAPGFVLKETSALTPPIAWTTVTNIPVNVGGQFQVILSYQPGNRFYLLNLE